MTEINDRVARTAEIAMTTDETTRLVRGTKRRSARMAVLRRLARVARAARRSADAWVQAEPIVAQQQWFTRWPATAVLVSPDRRTHRRSGEEAQDE